MKINTRLKVVTNFDLTITRLLLYILNFSAPQEESQSMMTKFTSRNTAKRRSHW